MANAFVNKFLRKEHDVVDEHPTYLYWRGERRRWEDANVHVTSLGWSTIGAVFEGIRAYWNAEEEELYVFRLREHLERLAQSMKLVRLPLEHSTAELTEIILDLLRANEVRRDTYIRPLGYTANAGNKRMSQMGGESEFLISTSDMPSHLLSGMTQEGKVSSWTRISDSVMPPRIKNLSNYRNGQLATMEVRQDGYDVAFMLNPQGKVAEAPGACVVLLRNGTLITPDVTSGILESITRDALITLVREELGVDVVERPVDRTELYLADEIFTCGTAAEITPVVSIDRYQIGDGKIGPVTQRLESLFHSVLRGEEGRWAQWRTPVWAEARVFA
jgi:branched-chain amino acid aminotransferase